MNKFIEHLEQEHKELLKQYYACGKDEIESGVWMDIRLQLQLLDARIRHEKSMVHWERFKELLNQNKDE